MNEHETVTIIDLPAEGASAVVADAPVPETAEVVDIAEDKAASALPPRAVLNEDGSITLTLAYPVVLKFRRARGDIREERLDHLVLHRLTGADMRAISAASRETVSTVAIARSARMSEHKMNAFFDRMDGADVVAAGEVVGHFLDSGQKTGR